MGGVEWGGVEWGGVEWSGVGVVGVVGVVVYAWYVCIFPTYHFDVDAGTRTETHKNKQNTE